MIPKAFDAIEKADIDALVTERTAERKTLEYKLMVPNDQDKDKKEFLADVSSFANAGGGDILFGVEDERDKDGKPTGIPKAAHGLAVTNAGAEQLRLENSVKTGIAPRMPVQSKIIEGFAKGPIILFRVPKSYSAPHMVTLQNTSRFFSRTSAGKYQLDVGEIRSAFALSESLPERVRRFRDERLGRIVAGETPLPLASSLRVVLHILPIQALDMTKQVDLRTIPHLPQTWPMGNLMSCYPRYNFDGWISQNSDPTTRLCRTYAQFFRSGAVEAVKTYSSRQESPDAFPARRRPGSTSISSSRSILPPLRRCWLD